MKTEEKIADLLIKGGKTLAVAESCTGGLISHMLTNIPGSSQFLKISVVAYSNEAKRKVLKVPLSVIKKYGAVSKETAMAMAKGVRRLQKTDFGLSITGIAGPTGGTAKKPVGLVFIAICTREKSAYKEFLFNGDRKNIKQKTANASLNMLFKAVAKK